VLAPQERGQARLPDLELNRVEVVIAALKGFQREAIAQVKEPLGWEGGLAPALFLPPILKSLHVPLTPTGIGTAC
jgi:hypothetical protein